MKWLNLVWLIPLLYGCGSGEGPQNQNGSSAGSAAADKLAWVDSADSGKDAATAIAKQDFRLLAVSGRGLNLPGIDVAEREAAKQQCGIRYMDGMGDVLKDSDHQMRWQKGYDYATAYNRLVVGHCLKQ